MRKPKQFSLLVTVVTNPGAKPLPRGVDVQIVQQPEKNGLFVSAYDMQRLWSELRAQRVRARARYSKLKAENMRLRVPQPQTGTLMDGTEVTVLEIVKFRRRNVHVRFKDGTQEWAAQEDFNPRLPNEIKPKGK